MSGWPAWASDRALAAALAAAWRFMAALAETNDAAARELLWPVVATKADELIASNAALAAIPGSFTVICAGALDLEGDDAARVARDFRRLPLAVRIQRAPIVHVDVELDATRRLQLGLALSNGRWWVIPAGAPVGARPYGEQTYHLTMGAVARALAAAERSRVDAGSLTA